MIKNLFQSSTLKKKASDYYQQAGIFKAQGNLAEALKNYQLALSCQADYPEAYYEIGNLYLAQNNLDLAIDNYRQAVVRKVDFADAYCNLGIAFQEKNELDKALENYRQALAINPNDRDVCCNLAELFNAQGNVDEAVRYYRQALSLHPSPDMAYLLYKRLGGCLIQQEKIEEVISVFQQVLQFNPNDSEAYHNLALAFKERKKLTEAISYLKKAYQLDANSTDTLAELFHTQLLCCDWSDYDSYKQKISEKLKSGEKGINPFNYLTVFSSPVEQQHCAKLFADDTPASFALGTKPHYQHDKIRVAYISADFRTHPLSFLMAGLFEQHDKTRFEIIAISLQPEEKSPIGQRIKTAFHQFIDVSQHSDFEVASLMRKLEIDIGVDLMGFTRNCRTGILAYRPAPVQVNYLGYPATMGTDYIDYILADHYVIPQTVQNCYTEKVVYLPECFQANDDKRAISPNRPTRSALGLPEECVVFCSFNNSYKITPTVFESWLQILKNVPDSVLWLIADNLQVQDNLKNEAGEQGVDSKRLVFADRLPYTEHLARLQLADLFLDTLPFNAGTTASDALWAGVPIITCSGETFAARMAGSLLQAIGLPELITENLQDYQTLALKLATNRPLLAEIKAKLAKNRMTSPLFNTERFCRHLESAYRMMWEHYQRGEKPLGFTVPPIE